MSRVLRNVCSEDVWTQQSARPNLLQGVLGMMKPAHRLGINPSRKISHHACCTLCSTVLSLTLTASGGQVDKDSSHVTIAVMGTVGFEACTRRPASSINSSKRNSRQTTVG